MPTSNIYMNRTPIMLTTANRNESVVISNSSSESFIQTGVDSLNFLSDQLDIGDIFKNSLFNNSDGNINLTNYNNTASIILNESLIQSNSNQILLSNNEKLLNENILINSDLKVSFCYIL